MRMAFVITDGNSYITFDKNNFQTTTSRLNEAKVFEDEVRANNNLKCIRKQLQKFNWKIVSMEELVESSKNNKTSNETKKQPFEDVDLNLDNLVEDIKNIHNTVKHLIVNKDIYEKNLTKINKEICDIEHYAEFEKLDACKGFKVYQMLRDARLRRRNIKDKLKIIEIFSDDKIENTNFEDKISKLEDMQNRIYSPRVLDKLFD